VARGHYIRRNRVVKAPPEDVAFESETFPFRGTDATLQACMTAEGNGRIRVQRGGKTAYPITCIHTVLYKGPIEGLPETLSTEGMERSNLPLPGVDVRFFALASFAQAVAEQGFRAIRPSMVGFQLAGALQERLLELLGNAGRVLLLDELGELASEYPVDSPEQAEIARIFEEHIFLVGARLPLSDGARALAETLDRRKLVKDAEIKVMDAYRLRLQAYRAGTRLPRLIPKRLRAMVGTIMGEMIDIARRKILCRLCNNIAKGAEGPIAMHWLCKRLGSPYRTIAVKGLLYAILVSGGAKIGDCVYSMKDLLAQARVDVVARAKERIAKASAGKQLHFWPHFAVKRSKSPFRKNLSRDLQVICFEGLCNDGAWWRYFTLDFPTRNYDFQAELHDALVSAGQNDCYYRFVKGEGQAKFKPWGIEIFDPWEERVMTLHDFIYANKSEETPHE